MRIRTKLLCILLALALPPLVAVSMYALHEAKLLGQELARRASDSYRFTAERELALMVDLIGEDINDNRQMLEIALAFLTQEAGRVLNLPPGQPAESPLRPAGRSASIALPPGLDRRIAEAQTRQLDRLLPTLSTLAQKLDETMLWAYVALPNGVLCTFPEHSRLPEGFDPRTRPWYQAAVVQGGTAWSILVDAATGKLTVTISAPIYGPTGSLLGVTGIDAPLEDMLPESDLSKRWGEGVRAVIVRLEQRQSGPQLLVLGSREFQTRQTGWQTPIAPRPVNSSDSLGLSRLTAAIQARQSELIDFELEGERYLAAFKPFPSTPAGLLVLVPKAAVLRQADSAESAILGRTHGMTVVVAGFALLAVGGAAVLAVFGARAVTRPVTALCRAAGRLAEGDLSAHAPVSSRDELGRLAATFNAMAPKLAERLRLKQDMLLAMEVQQNLLPKAPVVLPGLEIAGGTYFCDETGGDFFDYLELTPQDGTGYDVAIGDATGHGIAAALFMATGRALLRGGRGGAISPAALLTQVNALLCQDTADSGRFLTLYFLRIEAGGLSPEGRLRWARAGHDPALLYDPAADAFEELMGSGLPLGILPDYVYEEQSRPGLVPGQVLALGTDGIWEARSPGGEMYGKDRFREVLRRNAGLTADAILAAVHKDVAEFQAGAPRDDDITAIIIKATPA